MDLRADYRDLLTQAYDLDKPEAPPDELDHWRERTAGVGPVLELMCGSGRFLLPLLALDRDIDGTDASRDMLRACRGHAERLGLDVSTRLTRQRAEDLHLPRRYAMVFCAAGSFGLIALDAEVRRALAAVRRHLVPGGSFEFEVECGPGNGGSGGMPWWTRPDGGVITLRGGSRFDETTGIEQGVGVYELFVDGELVRTELNHWVRRYWSAAAITDAVRAVGFDEVRVDEAGGTLLRVRATRGAQDPAPRS